jgi:mannan endo-1,4-beta-mannosidase
MSHPRQRIVGLLLLVTALLLAAGGTALAKRPQTMEVDGRFLYDRCGEKVILRGANTMIVYWDRRGEATFPELAKTGANCCRIFWTVGAEAPPRDLDVCLANCRKHHMIPIPCVWDATGKWHNLQKCIDYWCRPDVVGVLRKYEDCLLVNIANEAGKRDVTDEQYRKAYADALVKMRAAGLHMPLVIDAAHWGRGEDYILENGPALVEADPDRNVLFSWHPWDTRQEQSRYKKAIDASIEKNLCTIVGEFSHVGVFFKRSIDWEYIVRYCQEREIGWLPWVWHCGKVGNPDGHSITTDRQFGHWANAPWGKQIAVESPYSIRKTSKRPYYLVHGECRDGPISASPPTAPANLRAEAAGGARVNLAWADRSDDEMNFDIQVRREDGWETVKHVAADATQAAVGGLDGLASKTEYTVRVGAWKGHGLAAWSDPVTVRTKASPAAGGKGTGLRATYHNKGEDGKFFEHPPVRERVDPEIDVDWGRGSPDPKIDADHFKVRWTGRLLPPHTGEYTFWTLSDDFAWLWVGGRKIIQVHGPNVRGWGKGTVHLEGGKPVDVRLEYREWDHRARIHLYWATLRLPKQIVPRGCLFPDASGAASSP